MSLISMVFVYFSLFRKIDIRFADSRGKIIDVQGNPVQGVEVAMIYYCRYPGFDGYDSPTLHSEKTLTDQDGVFLFGSFVTKGRSNHVGCFKHIYINKDGYYYALCQEGESRCVERLVSGIDPHVPPLQSNLLDFSPILLKKVEN